MHRYCCPQQAAQVPKASGQEEQGCFSTFPPAGTRGGQEVSLQSRPEDSPAPLLLHGKQCSPDSFVPPGAARDPWVEPAPHLACSPGGPRLKRIHALTTQAAYELHVDLEDFDNGTAYAHYGSFGVGLFSVDPEEDGYPLTVADYSGTAGDSLLKHSGMRFTTKDRDSDHSENNCAAFYRGAWWYRNCHTSNLNGQYLRGAHASYADGVEWSSWTGWQYSLKVSEMKIRPVREDR
eukprot:XP_023981863.1 fibrinogen C domain-containing protein 1-like [Physeter catodon]